MTPAIQSLVLPTLTNAFCEETVREEARRKGVVQRQGKVDAYRLLVVVVLGLVMRGPTAIAQLGQTFSRMTGTRLARSSFWYRFNPGMATLVQGVLDRVVLDARQVSVRPPGVLSVFKDVLAADATVMKVNDALRPVWKGTRRNSARAALKVHAWIRVLTGELVKYTVTQEAHADSRAFGIDQQLRGVLMLFDRGYASPSLWRRIDSVGGYFLTRIPAKWNQTIVSENRKHRGRARRLIGQSLQEAFVHLKRTIVDVDADFLCRIRGYGDTESRKEMKRFRVVAIRHPETNEFGLFATNAPPHMLAAEDIYQVYRLRWEVETFFKTLKSGCAANEFPSSKQHIVEILLYAGLLRAALAMRAKAQQTWSLVQRINHGQWMHWWNRQLPAALVELVGITESQLSIKQLLILLSDPNQGRLPTRFSFGGIP
jgi:putative transposase